MQNISSYNLYLERLLHISNIKTFKFYFFQFYVFYNFNILIIPVRVIHAYSSVLGL